MLTLSCHKYHPFLSYKNWALFLFLILETFFSCQAQQFGGNPTSTKWMQMNSDSLRVLFPRGYKHQALRVFNTSQYMLKNERTTIGNKSQKFNIILQPHTVISNGFVTLGPFRSVFLTTPSQDNFSLGTNNWLNQLGIHETWHALQYMNFKTGLANTFHTLFGEKGQAFIDQYFIPGWFWEGEAVFMETLLTKQGRGRLPSFLDTYKAMWLTNTAFNYGKIRNGSLKDNVPNKYQSGYITVAYGRKKYGSHFWHQVMQKALLNRKFIKKNNKKNPNHPFHLFKYGFYPLDAALNYHTNKKTKEFYKASIAYFKKKWKLQQKNATYTTVDTLKPQKTRNILNYKYPTALQNGNILALKYGYAQLPEIVQIDTSGNEKTIVQIGNTLQKYFSYGGDQLVWSEYRPDPRWGWKNYSVIRLFDFKTKKTKTLTRQSKYFSPSLSQNGRKIAAVEVHKDHSQIVLLDAKTGKKLRTLPNPHHYFFTYPQWDNSGTYIITGARDSLSNMALIKIALSSGREERLTPMIPKAIGALNIHKDFIYFPAGFGKEIQLYALRRKDHQLFKIANRPIGDYTVSVDTSSEKIYFSEYALQGFQVLSAKRDTSHWQRLGKKELEKIYTPYVPKTLKKSSILDDIPYNQMQTKRYYPQKHLFRVRNWAFESLYPKTSLLLESRDLMGKMQASAGGGYNFNEETPFIQANLTYGGFFPYFRIGIKRIFNRQGLTSDQIPSRWNETNWYAGLEVPLNLSESLYHRYISLSGHFHQSLLNFKRPKTKNALNRVINYYTLGLTFNLLRNETIQDINPKFGFAINMKYYHTLKSYPINQLNANLNIFLPGLFPNHSLYFTTSFSSKKKNNIYKFEDIFHYARGYHSFPYQQIYTMGINYQLPLLYPDIGLPWIYLPRIRLHLFFDYSRANLSADFPKSHDTFRSLGADLYFDTKIFKTAIPIGLRYVYLLDEDPKGDRTFQLSLNFPMNLFFQ